MATRYPGRQVAHVWAQGNSEAGQNSNGQFYFEGPAIYSYGEHYCAGYLTGPDSRDAFINADSNSVTTAKHVSFTSGAVRGNCYFVPRLTDLASYFKAFAGRPGDWTREERARVIARHVAAHLTGPKADSRTPREDVAAALFRHAGLTDKQASAAAAKALREADKRADKLAGEKLARERDGAARVAIEYAGRAPEVTRAALADTMAERGFSASRADYEWSQVAAELRKAKAEATRRGWKARARAVAEHAKAIRAARKQFPVIEAIRNRRRQFAGNRAKASEAIRFLDFGQLPEGWPETPNRYHWQAAESAAQNIVYLLRNCEHVRQLARVMGQNPDAMADHCEADADRLGVAMTRAEAAERAARELKEREERAAAVALCKRFLADPDGLTAEELRTAAGFLSRYRYAAPIPAEMPAELADREAIRATLADIETRRDALARKRAELALAEWRDGARWPGVSVPRHDGNGGALLRAVRVERDDSGAITGGTLETSQGAEVPLCHALRAFRFLKQCRETGREWRANGKTLAVGHFRIERIGADGSFRAGCHVINWPEVAALAERLGVAELAPADTTESRATA